MPQNLALEVQVINKFSAKKQRQRYLQFVTSTKNRKKLIADLHGGAFYEGRMLARVTGIEEDAICQAIKQLGIASRSCYVISENTRIDTRTLELNTCFQRWSDGEQAPCWFSERQTSFLWS